MSILYFSTDIASQFEQQSNPGPAGPKILRDFSSRNKERSIGRYRHEFRGLDAATGEANMGDQ